jgi:hypothetical protein
MCLKYIVQGHVEALKSDSELGMFTNRLGELITVLNSKTFIEYLDSNTAFELIDVYTILTFSFIIQLLMK